jgi:tRNA(Ile)-lysidine synthase
MKGLAVLDRVRKSITRYNMLPEGARVAVGVSGGPDSVCLLHALVELAPEYRIELSVAHLNHRLRGAESDEDERMVKDLAARLGLPFHHSAADVAAVKDNLEQAARRARRAFFADLIERGVIHRVALGHTRDDQAETVIFRLLRGAGLAGLAGIYPATADGYVRPLIDVTRAEVEGFLRARDIAWREDSSNRDPRFARNRIREALLPQLAREWNPQIRESLAHLADLAHEEERWWRAHMEDLAARFLKYREGAVEFRTGAVVQLPLATQRRFIRHAIAEIKGDLRGLEFGHVERVRGLMDRPEGDGRLGLPGALEVRRSFDWLRIAPAGAVRSPVPAVTVEVPGTYATADGVAIHFEVVAGNTGRRRRSPPVVAPKNATLRAAELSLCRLPARLELRGWKPGDQYCPEGQIHGQKIKEMFQRARVPSWRRQSWPIVGSGAKILWARGFGAAAEFAAGQEAGPVLRVWETASEPEVDEAQSI